ncbi:MULTISPECIES: LysR family transcriptional regulator [Pseudomonas syringae group]|uniref:LysR family transcriptional regulator n=1 Tax=Pseudomonas syringae group TaxID=136849 RepID=UPI001E34C9F8|nr:MULTISPECIES: LysR family transcriptional regulator [Pseudomonas]MCD5989210.1 LysR family transcriptional regulator [Pseudomonas quasicaspiana]MDU8361946.1 LysR family transcriptional regulator [Pseudomonas syringae group sp. J309-1]
MDSLSGIGIFVQVAQTRSFTAAARTLEVSSSAVGKSIARLEQRLGVRLFHRSTRSITLTAEGTLFLERCRRILGEVEAAELELSHFTAEPRGKLHISVPLQDGLMMPVLTAFMRRYPDIELDIDLSDRMVDIIEEGFDAVVRTGTLQDSRLASRHLGDFRLMLVASPDYLQRYGVPLTPGDLAGHVGLLHKFPATGKIEPWPLRSVDGLLVPNPKKAATCTTTHSLYHLCKQGMGIAYLADFVVNEALQRGELQVVLEDFTLSHGTLWMLWPVSQHASPKLRALIDFLKEHLLPAGGYQKI